VFPKFGVGKRTLSDEHFIIASAGLGDHTIPLRIFNPREIVTIKVKPLTDDNRTEA
jgi:predicted MPP superfamily phosphohydrolase